MKAVLTVLLIARLSPSIASIPTRVILQRLTIFLHLLGGGMVYRKDLEWFRANDYDYATASAVVLAMTAEFIQEVLEKNTTKDDDEVQTS
jgi:hypothetical protein